MKYNIGDEEFNTKKACLDRTRSIIYELGICKIKKKHKYFNFFCGLLANHSACDEKIGCGIRYFMITPNPLTRDPNHLILVRKDRSSVAFGWRHCNEFKPRSNKQNLINAMRNTISDQVYKFKKHNKHLCALCGTEDGKFHVDHSYPPFRDLVSEFIDGRKIPDKFGSDSKCMTTFIDHKFRDKWYDFHNKKCNLQILCESCNMKKH
jgi:hypothetical protein